MLFLRKTFAPWPLAIGLFVLGGCQPSKVVSPQPRTNGTHGQEKPTSKATVASAMPVLRGRRLIVDVEQAALDSGTKTFHYKGSTLLLQKGLRIALHADGHFERAFERLASSNALKVRRLPERLGGGWLFGESSRYGTRIWRAATWTAPLTHLNHVPLEVERFIMGFDRIYLRARRRNRLAAISADDGRPLDLGPLPHVYSATNIIFADDWRAVVGARGLGALATFDAGHSWHSLPIESTPYRLARVDMDQGDPLLRVHLEGPRGSTIARSYRLSVNGQLLDASKGRKPTAIEKRAEGFKARPTDDDTDRDDAKLKPLKSRTFAVMDRPALRLAIESGWPLRSKTTGRVAVVAYRGALAKVNLQSGEVIRLRERAFPENRATCTAMRVGNGIGFHCSEKKVGSVLYRYAEPMRVQLVARFGSARYVASSGNGALVVGGHCNSAAVPSSTPHTDYCVIATDGTQREVRIQHASGLERLVGLRDGRIALLVAPSGKNQGTLRLIEKDGTSGPAMTLRISEGAPKARALSKVGMWLRGFWETAKSGNLAGWIEAGGPAVGVRIGLDGKVRLLKPRFGADETIFGGRFAISQSRLAQVASATSDGGETWQTFDLPTLGSGSGKRAPGSSAMRRRSSSERTALGQAAIGTWFRRSRQPAIGRSCGPVGCGLRDWLVIGWGKTEGQKGLRFAETPRRNWPYLQAPVTRVICENAPAGSKPRNHHRDRSAHKNTWPAFFGGPPPKLRSNEEGLTRNESSSTTRHVRVYAWGRPAADWGQSGKWQLRVRDTLDPKGRLLVSAATRSPWSDKTAAAKGIGTGRFGYRRALHVGFDPRGDSALVAICRYNRCRFSSFRHGEPIVSLGHHASGSRSSPYIPGLSLASALRIGPNWFFSSSSGSQLNLWRLRPKGLERLTRLKTERNSPSLQLIRHLRQDRAALLVQSAQPEPDQKLLRLSLTVIPIDLGSGERSQHIQLASVEQNQRPCDADADGWLVDTQMLGSYFRSRLIAPHARRAGLNLRLVVNENETCVLSANGRVDSDGHTPSATTSPAPTAFFPGFFSSKTTGGRGHRHAEEKLQQLRCRLD